MERKFANKLGMLVGIAGLLALLGSGWLYLESRKTGAVQAMAPAVADAHGQEAEGAAHAGVEQSDLDRPVEELWAARCEHDIPQYECEECRYEVGVVRLPGEMMADRGQGGVIKTATATRMDFSHEIALSGEVGLNQEKTTHVTAPLSGQVKAVHAMVGDRVEPGTPLFDIDSHEVSESKATFVKALATMNLAQKTFDREAGLFEKKISAQVEVDEANAKLAEARVEVANARARLLRLGVASDEVEKLARGEAELSGLLSVRSPSGGVILEKHTVAGEYAEEGKDLLQINDLSTVWVWANLKEADLLAVRNARGTVFADVELPGDGKRRGKVDLVSGTMDEATRTVRARITLPNAKGDLRPGMYVGVNLLMPGKGETVAAPKASILVDEGRSFVFTHKEDDYWIRRPVTTGREVGGQVEILAGLEAGKKILADGCFVAKSDVLRGKMGAGCAE